MKKIIFLVAALLTVFSGIAAVTAYEGHMVDVKAHVENALMVSTAELNFGTVFPQEKLENQFYVGLSESFREQKRYSSVDYKMYWEPKPLEEGAWAPEGWDVFQAIWPYIVVQNDGVDFPKSAYVDKGNGIVEIGSSSLNKSDLCDTIHFVLDPPVFDKWYNKATDDLNGKTPSGILQAGQYYTTTETFGCLDVDGEEIPGVLVPQTDLGSNFKIQVTDVIGE